MRLLRAPWRWGASQRTLREELCAATRETTRLRISLGEMMTALAAVERSAEQTRLVVHLNDRQQRHLGRLPRVLDQARVTQAVHDAVERAVLHLDPCPHLVVESVLPDDVYRVLIKAIPPPVFFGARDPIKQNLRIPIDFGPALATRVWEFADEVIARDAIREAVLLKFRDALGLHYDAIFGSGFRERAARLPQAVSGGRIMLRRPGYFLAPHRDPKRAMITCLMYLAREGDDERYGTELFRLSSELESAFTETFYPGEHGVAAELVRSIPFRPNSMLVMLNGTGAHGARIPDDAPADLERYAFQFYIGPEQTALESLIADLPPGRQERWRRRKAGTPARPTIAGG